MRMQLMLSCLATIFWYSSRVANISLYMIFEVLSGGEDGSDGLVNSTAVWTCR